MHLLMVLNVHLSNKVVILSAQIDFMEKKKFYIKFSEGSFCILWMCVSL